jgi:hypothetical protein
MKGARTTQEPDGRGTRPEPVRPAWQVGDADEELQLAFAPLHKKAFGIAIGTATALLAGGATAMVLITQAERGNHLRLLAEYFYGYQLNWVGILIGGAWAFVVGFVAGWFYAFCRNLILAVHVFITNTRAELSQTRDFLDHI